MKMETVPDPAVGVDESVKRFARRLVAACWAAVWLSGAVCVWSVWAVWVVLANCRSLFAEEDKIRMGR